MTTAVEQVAIWEQLALLDESDLQQKIAGDATAKFLVQQFVDRAEPDTDASGDSIRYVDYDSNQRTLKDQFVLDQDDYDMWKKVVGGGASSTRQVSSSMPDLSLYVGVALLFDREGRVVEKKFSSEKELGDLLRSTSLHPARSEEEERAIEDYRGRKTTQGAPYSQQNFKRLTINYNANGDDESDDPEKKQAEVDLLFIPRIQYISCQDDEEVILTSTGKGFGTTNGYFSFATFFDPDELIALNEFLGAFYSDPQEASPYSGSFLYDGCVQNSRKSGTVYTRQLRLKINPDKIDEMIETLDKASSQTTSDSHDRQMMAATRLVQAFSPEEVAALKVDLQAYKAKKISGKEIPDPNHMPTVMLGTLAASLAVGGYGTHRMVAWEDNFWNRLSVLTKGFLATYGGNMNEIYGTQLKEGTKEPFLGRGDVIDEIIERITSKKGSRSTVLLGHKGSGKSAIVEHMAATLEQIARTDPRLQNYVFYSLSPDDLSGGSEPQGGRKKVKMLMKDIELQAGKGKTIVIFMDEVHGLPKVGRHSTSGDFGDVGNLMKPPMIRGKTESIGSSWFKRFVSRIPVIGRITANYFFGQGNAPFIVIGATTIEEWEKHVAGSREKGIPAEDSALADRFGEPIVIPDPEGDFLTEIVRSHTAQEETLYGIEYERNSNPTKPSPVIEKALQISALRNPEMYESRRSIEFLKSLRIYVAAREKRAVRLGGGGTATASVPVASPKFNWRHPIDSFRAWRGARNTPSVAAAPSATVPITVNDLWEFLMTERELPGRIQSARTEVAQSSFHALGKLNIPEELWGQLPGETLEDSILRRYRLLGEVGKYFRANNAVMNAHFAGEFDATPFDPRPKPPAPPPAPTRGGGGGGGGGGRGTTVSLEQPPSYEPVDHLHGRRGFAGGDGEIGASRAMHVEYPTFGSEALAPVYDVGARLPRPGEETSPLQVANNPYYGEAPEALRDNVVELFPDTLEERSPIPDSRSTPPAANDGIYEPANNNAHYDDVGARSPRPGEETSPLQVGHEQPHGNFLGEMKAETIGGGVTMGLMEGAWMGVEHFTGYHPSHSVRMAVDMPTLYAGTKVIAGGATLGGFAQGLLPSMVWMMPGMMAGWSGASSVSNFAGEQLGIDTLKSEGAGNRLVSAVSGGAAGAVSHKVATHFLPKAILGKAGPLGGAIMAYPLIGEGMDFVADQAGVSRDYTGRTTLQVTTSGAVGYLAHAGIQAAISGATGTTATTAATAGTTAVVTTATAGTAATATVAATGATATAATTATAGGGTVATAGGVAAGVSGAAVIAGVAVVTAAAITGFAVYKNATTTDEELGKERSQDNAWGRFLDGDGLWDGVDDALFGAD